MTKKIDFDFGFTALDDIEVMQNTKEKYYTKDELENALHTLANEFSPLLNNLKANPEKETIRWPNRIEKIEQFEKRIDDLINTLLDN